MADYNSKHLKPEGPDFHRATQQTYSPAYTLQFFIAGGKKGINSFRCFYVPINQNEGVGIIHQRRCASHIVAILEAPSNQENRETEARQTSK
jgi:hypothetical protein